MKIKNNDLFIITGIVLFSLVFRLYAFLNASVINSDGVYYINQARALFNNDWEMAKNCGFDFISLYHLLIPVFYRLLGDWIYAGQSISILFGTISVIPFYFTLRRFFSVTTSMTAGLAFAVNPFFVSYSVELVKDPLFWFFALFGIYFLMSAVKRDKLYLLPFSSAAFLLAGFARFEVLIYFAGSIIYILLFEEKKLKKLLFFTMPAIVLVALGIVLNVFFPQERLNLWTLYFLPRTQHFFHYYFESLMNPDILAKSVTVLKLFILRAAKVIYLPYLPIFLMGLFSMKSEFDREKRFRYFILLSFISIIALYFFYMKMQVLSPRYAVFFILPAYIFICFGIERIVQLGTKKGIRERSIILSICLYIIFAVVVSTANVPPEKSEKAMYKTVGEYISKIEHNKAATVMASDPRIMFYADLHSGDIKCGNQLMKYDALIKMNYQDIAYFLKSNNVEYFLWEAKAWEDADYDFLTAVDPAQFRELMNWNSEHGRLILFKVMHR